MPVSSRLRLALAVGVGFGLLYVAGANLIANNEARLLLTPSLTPRQAAEAGIHKAIYCLNATTGVNCGGTFDGQYVGETTTVYGDATFSINVTGQDHERTIRSTGIVGGQSRHALTVTATDLPPMEAVSFVHPLQAGEGGLDIGARTTISGDVSSDTPFPTIQLTSWRNLAAAGAVHVGDYHPTQGDHLGPAIIDGNLTIDEGVTIYLDGPVLVGGTATVRRGATVSLNSAFGSYGTVLLADNPSNPQDGRIVIEAGAVIEGSGEPGSLLLAVATAVDPEQPAIRVAGLPGDLALLAPNGTVIIADRSQILAAAAYRIEVGQRVVIGGSKNTPINPFAAYPGGTWRIKE